MNAHEILTRRLFAQRVTGIPFATPDEVVRWHGCVQSQELAGSRWSVGQRVANATDADVLAAFNDGRFLRTHILRPTWHYVMPEDILWIQQATAHRVERLNAGVDRQTGLDERLLARSKEIIARSLEGSQYRTRRDLAATLGEHGIEASGQRLAHIVMHAELQGLICSGPMRGKQATYALVAERAPQARRFDDDDEALGALALRYFASHGPATERDFAWWASLTLEQSRRGVEIASRDLAQTEHDGQTYWFSEEAQPPGPLPDTAWLLPDYDEAIWHRSIQFPTLEATRDIAQWTEIYVSPIIIGTTRLGLWRRKVERKVVALDTMLFAPAAADDMARIEAAVERYSAYMELPVELSHL